MKKKNKNAQAMAKARWKKTSKEQRREHARNMLKARWNKDKKDV